MKGLFVHAWLCLLGKSEPTSTTMSRAPFVGRSASRMQEYSCYAVLKAGR